MQRRPAPDVVASGTGCTVEEHRSDERVEIVRIVSESAPPLAPGSGTAPYYGHRQLGATVSLKLALPLAAAIAAAAPVRAASAQEFLDARSAAHLRDQYLADLDTVHVKVLALAKAIPEDKYSWRPAEGVRTISEALMHVASEWYFYAPQSVGGKAPADFGPPREKLPALEKITSKAQVIEELEKAWAHCRAQLAAAEPAKLTGRLEPWKAPLAQSAFIMSGDLHEHLGQLIAYARSVGVKPPWSK
jgi:uncharacterized damage-inducible protein DinB